MTVPSASGPEVLTPRLRDCMFLCVPTLGSPSQIPVICTSAFCQALLLGWPGSHSSPPLGPAWSGALRSTGSCSVFREQALAWQEGQGGRGNVRWGWSPDHLGAQKSWL